MSPTCAIKPKQSIRQSKPKYFKNKTNDKLEQSITNTHKYPCNDESIYVDLDTKCSCVQLKSSPDLSIQFSRRYLQCQSSMPISILRLYIQQILPHSSMTRISFYDSNDRLLKDSDLLSSLQTTKQSSSCHIPIRFTLFNQITSLGHCLCASSSSSMVEKTDSSFSSLPKIIKQETLDKALSTCSVISSKSFSPCLSSLLSSSSSSPSSSPNELSKQSESSSSMSIVNLLTPPSSHSSFSIENIVHPNTIHNQSIIDEITSQFGEICPPLPKKSRNRSSKKPVSTYPKNLPLDLSIKKRSSSFDFFSSQAKWIKT